MARTALIAKAEKKPKFSTRKINRCKIPGCGRIHGYMRKYGVCRIHFRELASNGEIPGVKKSSW